MSTVSSTTSVANPYAVAYSTSDISGSDTTSSAYGSSSSSKSSSSSSSSSGSYSQGLVSQMSGIDVNSMVNEMMSSDVIKLNSLLGAEQTTQWTQDRYRSVITNVQNFSSNYFDVLSNNYALSASKYSVNSAQSNNSLVSATASNLAKQGNYSVSWTQLATAAQLTNAPVLTAGSNITNSSTFSSLLSSTTGAPTTGNISFTVNGTTVNYDLSANKNKSVSQVMSDLSNLAGNATFSYSELTGKFSITDNTTGNANYLTIGAASSDTTTQNFLNKVFGTGLSSSTTSQDIGNTGGAKNIAASTAGQNGSFTITEPDGSSNSVTESSNKFTIDGVSYNFTNSNASSSGTAVVNVSTDVSSVVNKIQTFVNDYNNLIGGITDATNEKKDYNYKPLTSSQESQMTAAQITQWNQKAQQGLLANDDNLTSMLSSMRAAFYTPVSGNGLTMGGIGLSTSDDPSQGGKITVDVKKLTQALQNNPQQVINLFTQTSTSQPIYTNDLSSSAVNTRNSEEGIFQRLSDISQKYTGTYVDKSGNQGILLMKAGMPNTLSETKNTLYTQFLQQQTSVSDFKTKMTSDASMYTNKFTALQSALSQLNSQQSYLSSMLSSSSSN